VNQSAYDVVHAMLPVPGCDVYHPHAGLAAAAVAEGSRVSMMFNPRRSRFADVERALLTSARPPVVLALSEYVKRSIRRHYSLDDAALPVLFNAVDLDRFQPSAKRPRDEVNALFVGQDFQRKGLPETLVALSALQGSPLRLTVVGRRDGNLHWPAQAGVRVTFAGEAKDTRPFYDAADFFVLPTKHDPCSLVVLEALAMGLPVISTRFNGACEVMTDGVHGFVLDNPVDVDALAAAMRKMLDPDLRARMSRACLELRPTLSYDHHLRSLLEVYGRVVQAKSSADARDGTASNASVQT
jgi:UDP-glucose:(heptosyl)LPS alpha-1,3-glucosyltransferase